MLTDAEVQRIARLARIQLTDTESQGLKKDLSSILDYIATLNAADTTSVEPLYQTTGLVNSTQEDVPRHEFPPTDKLDAVLLDQAPARTDRLVKVRSVLKK